MPRCVQTARSLRSHSEYLSRSKWALRPLSTSVESPGALIFGVQRLQGIDQHARDVAPGAQHAQARVVHVLERVGFAGRDGVADAGLHVAPPTVIGAAEAHQVAAPRVVAGQAHRLHDGFGARHMEGNFLLPGNLQEALDIERGDRVIGAEHRPEVAHAFAAARNAFLVEIVAEDVDAVGTGEIVELVAVQIGDLDARGGLQEGAALEVLAHEAAELKRHAVARGELQIGNAAHDVIRQIRGFAKAFRKGGGQTVEAIAPRRRNVLGRVVGAKEKASSYS
jgi:hypothetical protein